VASRKSSLSLLGLLLASAPMPALAANCDSSGSLFFLGDTSNASNSVWLSFGQPGLDIIEARIHAAISF
jgi:hypothetical protein